MTGDLLSKGQIHELAQKSFGVVPGIIKEIAEDSVAVAYQYLMGTQIMEKSSLSNVEVNAIELKISILNQCESCIKGHSFLLKRAGLPDLDIDAIRTGKRVTHERLNSLIQAAEYIYFSGNGIYSDLVLDFFENAELTKREIYEIIGLISLKTISNYVNNYLHSVQTRIPTGKIDAR